MHAPAAFLGAYLLAGILVSALLLWLSCRIVRVRFQVPAKDSPKTTVPVGVGFIRAFFLALAVGVVGVAVQAATGLIVAEELSPPRAFWVVGIGLVLCPVLSLVILRMGLPAGWLRCLGVLIVWNLASLLVLPAQVLVLQRYAFETFIIPTGSMAETFLGAHKEVKCPQCGHTFAVNASTEADPVVAPPQRIDGCTCPNCRQEIVLTAPGDPGGPAAGALTIPDPGPSGGDRVLAYKGLFGPDAFPPRRFDPVIFDWPGEPGRPPERPVRYLARLVGLPGEMIAIHRGKLFVLPADEVPASAGEPPADFGPDEQAATLFGQGKFRILRKSPEQVLALMRLVHDDEHARRDLDEQRWTGEGWRRQGGIFVTGESVEPAVLRYQHILPGTGGRAQLITDFSGYNTGKVQGLALLPGANWASDLILECEVRVESTDGSLSLELSRGPNRYHASFHLGKGTVALTRSDPGKEDRILTEGPVPLPHRRWVRLRLANVDDRLLLWVDDELPLGGGVEYDQAPTWAPVKENDLDRPAALRATGVAVAVRKLRLYRDTYYTANRMGNPANADVPDFDPADEATWKHLAETPVAAYRVKADHYFVLGDNSAQSSDSRAWGLVPRDMLLGRVVMRYWPWSRLGWVR